MKNIVVAGIGTDVGKTIVSAIIVSALQADYWKPIQCGPDSDAKKIKQLTAGLHLTIHPSTYNFRAAVSPHHAAALENSSIPSYIPPPITSRPLVIESVGGICVPLNSTCLSIDFLSTQQASWILVSKHYLGSINHTLLTAAYLKSRNILVHSLIFNGETVPESEQAILQFTGLTCSGRLQQETNINRSTIQRYAALWKPQLQSLL
ncbi:MAG: dethiobiotin synthase [Parachlamydiaceae bacterium]|nr:dethiobiotin synthase [Parachlamydiaceae bacterium]